MTKKAPKSADVDVMIGVKVSGGTMSFGRYDVVSGGTKWFPEVQSRFGNQFHEKRVDFTKKIFKE